MSLQVSVRTVTCLTVVYYTYVPVKNWPCTEDRGPHWWALDVKNWAYTDDRVPPRALVVSSSSVLSGSTAARFPDLLTAAPLTTLASFSSPSVVRRELRFFLGHSWAEDDPCSARVTSIMSRPSSSFTNEFIRGCCLGVASGSGGPKVQRPPFPVLSPRQGSPSMCCFASVLYMN